MNPGRPPSQPSARQHLEGTPVERLRRRADGYWESLRINLPYWWVMAWNLVLWVLLIGRDRSFGETTDLPGSEPLEEHWRDIRDELLPLLDGRSSIPTFQDLDSGQRRLTDDDKWRMFAFRFYGVDAPTNRARCPRTAEILDSVPGMHTAMFSIVEAGKCTPWHSGPFKGVLRYHLPLKVPGKDSCGIRVLGGETRYWEEGVGMVFDDTYIHKAWNGGDEVRVLLWMDIIRPMPWPWLDRMNRRVLDKLARSERIRGAIDNAEHAAAAVAA